MNRNLNGPDANSVTLTLPEDTDPISWSYYVNATDRDSVSILSVRHESLQTQLSKTGISCQCEGLQNPTCGVLERDGGGGVQDNLHYSFICVSDNVLIF